MEVEQSGAPMDPRKVLSTLWRRKWWVVVALDVAVALSLFSTLRQPELFASTAIARYGDPSQVSVFGSIGGVSAGGTPERQAVAEEIAAEGVRVTSLVTERMGGRMEGVRSLSASASAEAQIVSFSATSTDPVVARDAATEYATAYVEIRRESVESAIASKAAELRRYADETAVKIAQLGTEIARLDIEIASKAGPAGAPPAAGGEQATLASQRALLQTQRESLNRSIDQSQTRAEQLDIEATVQSAASADLVQRASTPGEPFAPTPLRDAIVAGFAGLLAGLGLALAREYFDDRAHVIDDVIAGAAGIPLLGTIPFLREARTREGVVALAYPQSVESEAYRTLRTSLQFRSLRQPVHTILVTSPMQSEGKTTTAVNLAASLATAGARVVIVDFDLRRPRVSAAFGIQAEAGLTSVLLGTADIDAVLHDIDVPSTGSLQVLPPGPLPPNPAELLGAPGVGELLASLRGRADFVILDTPPVLPITDAIVATHWADGVVLVSRVGSSHKRQIAEAVRRLAETEVPVLGLVVNGAGNERGYYQSRYYGDYLATAKSEDAWENAVAHRGANGAQEDRPEEPVHAAAPATETPAVVEVPSAAVSQPQTAPSEPALTIPRGQTGSEPTSSVDPATASDNGHGPLRPAVENWLEYASTPERHGDEAPTVETSRGDRDGG